MASISLYNVRRSHKHSNTSKPAVTVDSHIGIVSGSVLSPRPSLDPPSILHTPAPTTHIQNHQRTSNHPFNPKTSKKLSPPPPTALPRLEIHVAPKLITQPTRVHRIVVGHPHPKSAIHTQNDITHPLACGDDNAGGGRGSRRRGI